MAVAAPVTQTAPALTGLAVVAFGALALPIAAVAQTHVAALSHLVCCGDVPPRPLSSRMNT